MTRRKPPAGTIRAFASIPGNERGEKIESFKSADGERSRQVAKQAATSLH